MNICQTFLLSAALLVTTGMAQAGIQVETTRVIYPADKDEVTLSMFNNAQHPKLVQAWIDEGDPSVLPAAAQSPFIASPPLFRVNADKGQTVRIVYTGGALPQDRESVYWLNLLEIPPKVTKTAGTSSGHVQFPVRTRMKIFYRPANLPGSQQSAISGLRWQIITTQTGKAIECENPAAWNVSFIDLTLEGNALLQSGMCPARGKKTFPLAAPVGKRTGKLTFSSINDFGGFDVREAVLDHNG